MKERKNHFLLKILNGQILQECSAIVCSRPYASKKLQRTSALTRHIEVLSFKKQQMEVLEYGGVK